MRIEGLSVSPVLNLSLTAILSLGWRHEKCCSLIPFPQSPARISQMIRIRIFGVRYFAALLCVALGVLLSIETSGVREEIRKSQNLGFKELLEVPKIVSNQLDGKMYILLTEGMRAFVFNSDERSSSVRLSRFGIDLSSPETRDLIYLAHTDRFRLAYPSLNIVFGFMFGSFSFLIINLLSLYALLLLYFRYLGEFTLNGIILALMLMASTVPVYSLTYMPETFLYTLVTIYFVLLHQLFIDESKGFLDRRISRQIIFAFPIIACLAKPMFVLIFPVLILVIIKLRRRTPVEVYFNVACMIMFALAWLYSRRNNSTPFEVIGQGNPLKNVISPSGLANKAPQENYTIGIDELNLAAYPKLVFSELSAQISKNNNSTIILLLVVLMILWSYKAFRDMAFLTVISIGAIMSQAQGQGFGTNLRWMNYAIIVGVFLAGKAWSKPRALENELISGT